MGIGNFDLHKLLKLTFVAAVLVLSINVWAHADDSDDSDNSGDDTDFARTSQVSKIPS